MLVIVVLLTLMVFVALVLFNRVQQLQQQVYRLQRYSRDKQHHAEANQRMLKCALDALQRRLLEGLPHLHPTDQSLDVSCRLFLISNLSEVVLRASGHGRSVHQAVEHIAAKEKMDMASIQLFVRKQPDGIVQAWQRNQISAYISLCCQISRLPELAKAS